MKIAEDEWESVDDDGGEVDSEELDERDVPFVDGRNEEGNEGLEGGKVSAPTNFRFRVIASARISRVVTVKGRRVKTGPPNPASNTATSPSPLRDVPLPRTLARLVRRTPDGKLDPRDWARVARQAFASGGMKGWSRTLNPLLNSTPQQAGRFQWEIKRTRLLPPLHDVNDPKLQQNQNKKALMIAKALWAMLYRRRFSMDMPTKLRAMLDRYDFWYAPDEVKYLRELSRLFDGCLGSEESESDSDYEGDSGASGSRSESESRDSESRDQSEKGEEGGEGGQQSDPWDQGDHGDHGGNDGGDDDGAYEGAYDGMYDNGPGMMASSSDAEDDEDNRPFLVPAAPAPVSPPLPAPLEPAPLEPAPLESAPLEPAPAPVGNRIIQPSPLPAWTDDARWRGQLVMRVNAFNESSRTLLIQPPIFRFGANSSATFPLAKRDYERVCSEGSMVHMPYTAMKTDWEHGVLGMPGRGVAMALLQFADKQTRRTVGWVVMDLFSTAMLHSFPAMHQILRKTDGELRALIMRGTNFHDYTQADVDAMERDTLIRLILKLTLQVKYGVNVDMSPTRPSSADLERARRTLYASFHELVPLTRRHEFIEFDTVPRGEKQTSFPSATAQEVSAWNKALRSPTGIAEIVMQCTAPSHAMPILQTVCKLFRSLGAHYVVMHSTATLPALHANFKEGTVHTIEVEKARNNMTELVEKEFSSVKSILVTDTLKCER